MTSINSIHPQNTENAAMFIVRFAVMYFFTVLSLVGLNLVAWDRRDTRPNEEVDWDSQGPDSIGKKSCLKKHFASDYLN